MTLGLQDNRPQPREPDPVVSVIVPARNQAARLPLFFAALERQSVARSDYEVILVDDCSVDDTFEVARAAGARALRLQTHGGPYVARNLGIEHARGRFLAFTDADCEPTANWIENGIRAFSRTDAEMLAGEFRVPMSATPSLAELLHCARHLDQKRNAEEHHLSGGGNLWVRLELFQQIGSFNARLLAGGDKEFCQRAVAGGAKIEYAADVVTAHPPCQSHRVAAKRAFRMGFGAAQHRYHAEGPARNHPRICTRPGAYIPRRRIYGFERLERVGYNPTRRQRTLLPVYEYVTIRLPIVAGNLVGTVKEAWLAGAAATRESDGTRNLPAR